MQLATIVQNVVLATISLATDMQAYLKTALFSAKLPWSGSGLAKAN